MRLNVLDLFSGAGGFSLGFELAGFDVIGCVEWDKDAMDTHQYNLGKGKDILGDITKVSDDEIRELYGDTVDVIIAGPSCQSFSNANRRDDPNSEKAKERNKLFFEVLRIAEITKPKVIVIENVPQILTRDNGYAKDEIHRYLGGLGYKTVSKVLVSSDYGVPEKRKRAFFVAVHGDEEFDFNEVKVKGKVTIKDAISDLYGVTLEESDYVCEPLSEYQEWIREGSKGITQHFIKEHNENYKHRISYVPQGGNWEDIPKSEYRGVSLKKGVTHSNRYRRLEEDGVSPTVTTKKDLIHPIENREISIREAARIQSFPDWFYFLGSKTAKARQIGNAVPPLMARYLAEAIKLKIARTSGD